MRNIIPFSLLCLFLLGACTTTDPLRSIEVADVSVEEAVKNPALHRGKLVRWGGTILSTKNRKDHTLVEVLAKPLKYRSEPDDRENSPGRFMIRIAGFIDPAEYREPNRIVVVGTLAGITRGKVGSYLYSYPLVEAQQHRLWSGEYQVADPYYYHSPWYDSPFYGWPYWHYPHYPHRPPRPPRPPVTPPSEPPTPFIRPPAQP